MRHTLIIPLLTAAIAYGGSPKSLRKLKTYTGTPKAYAFNKAGVLLDSAEVTANGYYQFPHLSPGEYNVKIQSNDNTIEITNLEHLNTEITYHITGFEAPAQEVVTLSDSRIKTTVPGAARGISVRAMTVEADVPVATESETRSDRDETMIIDRESLSSGAVGSGIKAGQITAGMWRDLDNWEKWKITNQDAGIAQYQNTWGFTPEKRFSVTFKEASGKAMVGEKVYLKQNGKVVWEAVTDNKGMAEFWAGMFESNSAEADYKVSYRHGERNFEFKIQPYTGSSEIVNIPLNLKAKAVAEIAFVVDATGSMGDEINYLQAEMLDVIARVKESNKCLDLRVGSVFYRDNGDEYVTRTSDFNSNPSVPVNFIFEQAAGGGGDFPEAVDEALKSSVDELSWSDHAVSKLMFLVLDAPPHEDSASAAKVRQYAQKAAQKGIKIIPVTASGINQSTEFLMKYLAITTNGSYVYITDHSGIGGSHEKPTGVKENVQYLNDLLVDIIKENTAWEDCSKQDSLPNNPGTVEIIQSGQWQAQFYPNPAIDHFMIKSSEKADEIIIHSQNGAEVYRTKPDGVKTKIETGNLATGVYIVTLRKGAESLSCRMMVMHP